MNHYVGIDVSLEASSVCVVDGNGKIVCESKILSEPDALITWLKGLDSDHTCNNWTSDGMTLPQQNQNSGSRAPCSGTSIGRAARTPRGKQRI